MSFTPFQTPPPDFFTITGIYQHRYDPSVVSTFNEISTIINVTYGGVLPDPFNNRFEDPPGKMWSFGQYNRYNRLFQLFRCVYAHNSNQSTIQTVSNPAKPYKFCTFSEYNDFKESVGLVQQLYNVEPGLSIEQIFVLPFPPFAQSFPPPTA